MKQTIVLNDSSQQNSADSPPGLVHVYVTDRDRRFETESELPWQTQRAASFAGIDLNPGTTFQEILGFGVALTDAACYWLDRLSASARREFLREIFHPAAMGLNTCRVCIGASDYAVEATSTYNASDPICWRQMQRWARAKGSHPWG